MSCYWTFFDPRTFSVYFSLGNIFYLSSLPVTGFLISGLSRDLQKLCPDGIALHCVVTTNSSMTTETQLNSGDLFGGHIQGHEPLARPAIVGLIKDIKPQIFTEQLSQHLQSDIRMVKVRCQDESSSVKLTFCGNTLMDHTL